MKFRTSARRITFFLAALTSITSAFSQSNLLINVDFGTGTNTSKVGAAAIGQAPGDYWNFYTRDDGQGGWKTSGAVSNLKFANSTTSAAGMTVLNAPGAWGNGSSDPMFDGYIYPLSGGNATVSITNLPAGNYDFYLYGQDAKYQVSAGGADFGTFATTNAAIVNPVTWQEGVQYVVVRGVSVPIGQAAVITVRPGLGGYAVISGFQIIQSSGVSNSLPPSITSQPGSVTAGVGSNVTFTVLASGTAPFSYQWLFNASPLAGANNYSLSLSGVQTTDSGTYRAIVSNPFGSATSVVATLTVSQLMPVITNQPQSQTVAAGSNVAFTVAAIGTPALRYQWQFKGSSIPGATGTSFAINNAQNANAGNYSVRVFNGYGTITSSVATLTVLGISPSIVSQPANATVVPGTNVTFSVAASGSSPLAYQWRYNGTDIPTATKSSLTLTNVQPSQAGNYSAVVTNFMGSATSGIAVLTVTPINRAPVASSQNVVLNFNDPASFSLSATDADGDPLTYTVVTNPAHGTLTGTAPNLTFQPDLNYSGADSLTFTANDGQTNSAPATISITVLPDGTLTLIDVDFGAGSPSQTGQEIGLAATGRSTNDFWNYYSRDDAMGNWLTFGSVSALKTAEGLATATGLTVDNAPGAWGNGSADPMYNAYIYPFGGNLTVTITNLEAGAYNIYVYGIDANYKASAEGKSYGVKTLPNGPVVNPVVWQENLQYVLFQTVRVSSSRSITITVTPGAGGYATLAGLQIQQVDAPPPVAPAIVQQPSSQTVSEGADVTFSVAVSGTSPFDYQWRSNGVDIGGAKDSSLTLHQVTLAASASYSIRITNCVGAVISDDAVLSVTHANHAPTANGQSVVITQNTPVNIVLSGSDPDADILSFSLGGLPGHGTISGTPPNVSYQPAAGFSGADSFSFKANDGQLDSALATVIITILGDQSKALLNVDCGAGASPGLNSGKVGPAAIGQATNDFWNFYSRDDGHGNWLSFGSLANLKFADQSLSGAGLTIANAPGAWGNGSSDPMFDTYIYPFNGGNVTVTVTNLPQGQYDIYAYGIDSSYEVLSGSVSYGVKALPGGSMINPVVWHEGSQYVVFRNVQISGAQPMVLTVRPGSGGYATLSGFQIAGGAPTNHAPVALAQNLTVNQDGSAGIVLAGTDADGDPLTFTISSMPSHGSLSGTPPNITYSPLPGFSGTDAFMFKANDGKVDSLDATVNINVGASATGRLLSVDFGTGSATSETGPAAVGQSSNDFWNFYTRDDGQGGWLNFGALQNLKYSDGTPSAAGLTVANAPGAWGNGSSDAMYNSYIYPFSGNATVTVTNIGPGTVDLYVYGIDAQYQVSVGALDCGIKTTTNAPIMNPIVWHDGEQYVIFRGLQITNAADAITITVLPGISGYAIISGVQLNSGDGMATNTSTVTNSAPIARANVLNALTSSDGDTNIVVVSANGTNAQIILDALLSTDADNDTLTYSWLEESLVPFAAGVTATNTFDVGSHTVTLLVNDGKASSSATLEFKVITVPDAMVELAVTVEKSDLDRATKRQLESVLIDNSQNSDLANLDAFVAKVQNYVAPTKPQSAAVLNSAAQKLIDSASKP